MNSWKRIVFVLLVGLSVGFVGVRGSSAESIPAYEDRDSGGTILPTTLDDELIIDGDCSLREAVLAANLGVGFDNCPTGNSINLQGQTYEISLGELPIETGVTLTISGGTIDANGTSRILNCKRCNLLLEDITLREGGSTQGGAVYLLAANATDSSLLNLRQVEFVDNSVTDAGGAIYCGINCNIITNLGFSSRFENNSADNWGGAIYSRAINGISLEDLTFTDNYAGFGGAIYFGLNSSDQNFSDIAHSAFINNSGLEGGAIYMEDPLTGSVNIENTTFDGNTAWGNGGAISTRGVVRLNFVTITNNTADFNQSGSGNGGGVFTFGEDSLIRSENSVIALNDDLSSSDGFDPDCEGRFQTFGHNFLGLNSTDCTYDDSFFPSSDPNDIVGIGTSIDPKLGALQGTYRIPEVGSPLLRAANPSSLILRDQILTPRPLGGSPNDIGAIESSNVPTAISLNEIGARSSFPIQVLKPMVLTLIMLTILMVRSKVNQQVKDLRETDGQNHHHRRDNRQNLF